ncbi:hypothetical protein ACFO5K_01250 [Nocardia halotolerans]|uniref:Uncharacterized protein n=1 Tax=Nocardia halotolerans TaxID=1755878 RepID=A0ABV8VDA6_9NOCA
MSRVSPWLTGIVGQSRAINDLDAALLSEQDARRRQARALATVQAEVQSSIDQVDSRVGAVGDQLGAVLDWTEFRIQLLEFEEYQARTRIRKVFRALAQGGPARLPDVEDVPGYWLPPAAKAVLSGVLPRNENDTDALDGDRVLEQARERDPIRADLLVVAAGVSFGGSALLHAAVSRLLTGPVGLGHNGSGVAQGWRSLWVGVALGGFGPVAAEVLSARLADLFGAAATDAAELAAWDRAIKTFGSTGDSTPAEALIALRNHLVVAQDDTEPVAIQDVPSWDTYLRELLEEPSPAEHSLLREMEQLPLPAAKGRRSEPSWGTDAATVVALVRADLFDPDAPIPLRRLALESATPLLRAQLAGILIAPGPVVTVVKRHGTAIEVTGDAYDPERLAAVERMIVLTNPVTHPSKPGSTAVCAGLAAAALLLVAFGYWIPTLLFALMAPVPVWKYRDDCRTTEAALARRNSRLAEVRAELTKACERNVAAYRHRTEEYRAAREALEHLLEALPPQAGRT